MKLRKALTLTSALFISLSSFSFAQSNDYKLSDEEMKKASQIYFDRCAGCHGMLRKGATGPNLEPQKTRQMGTEALKAIIHFGTAGGMPDWGASGELTPDETMLMAKFIQNDPPPPPETSLDKIKETWKLYIPPEKRPSKPMTSRNWKNYMGVVLRDVGKVAIIDGDTKELINIVNTGFAVHILRMSASGRYMYSIGRDGKVTLIDLWMEKPDVVAEVKTCNDARSVDTSKYKGKKGDFLDKFAVVGCYWPPAIVTLDGQTLEPLKIVSTSTYAYDKPNEFIREARVASIVASHHAPEWVINIKEAGQIWLYDYSDPLNPKIKSLNAERFLHDGGWDSSKRYFLVAANMRNKVVAVDTEEGKVAAIVETGNKPHPGRGANIDHPKYGPIWCTGHLGENTIACIGTDPKGHPEYAWKVVKKITLPGEGGGNLFVKTHPNSKYMYADRPLNPDKEAQTKIYVIDKEKLEVVGDLKTPEKYLQTKIVNGKEIKPRGPVHLEFNDKGDELWVAVWGNKVIPSAILIYDDKTLKLKNEIEGDWIRTPTGHFNVVNTQKDIY